jgi:hypothetical protein
MNACIVHDSSYGNGELLANTLKNVFEARGVQVTLRHVEDLPPAELAALQPDLLVVGAAIRKFFISGNVKRWIRAAHRELNHQNVSIANGAVFLTHGLPVRYARRWGERLVRRLSRAGFVSHVYPVWISGRVTKVEGPFEEGVLQAVERQADDLLRMMPHPA